MSAEEREMMEEVEAIKEAQKIARELYAKDFWAIDLEPDTRAVEPPGWGLVRGDNAKASGPTEGPIVRWLKRSAVQG